MRLRLALTCLAALTAVACAPGPTPSAEVRSPGAESPSPELPASEPAPTASAQRPSSEPPASAEAPSPSPGPTWLAVPPGPTGVDGRLYDLPSPEFLSEACAGVGLEGFRLTGHPTDERVAWLVNDAGSRLDVLFAPGLRARFVPSLEIVRDDGVVVAHEGDLITGGCVTGRPAPDSLLILVR